MHNNQNMTITEVKKDDRLTQQVKYLDNRLHSLFYEKDGELEKAFHLRDDDAPRSPEEFKERIAAGKYTFYNCSDDDEDAEESDYFSPMDIRWRDPAVKADRKGYTAAREKLMAAKKDVEDQIMIKTPEEAFKALEAFKTTTFH